ncbi:unnamed protein product [Symbiodinium sp. CCMP2456]|nr:unnamed protein product [Symbiodinium sp. CCMP2456]
MTVDSSRQVDVDAIELDDGVQQLDEEKDFDPCGLEEVYIHVVTRKLKND